jgi:hypothetical protein
MRFVVHPSTVSGKVRPRQTGGTIVKVGVPCEVARANVTLPYAAALADRGWRSALARSHGIESGDVLSAVG